MGFELELTRMGSEESYFVSLPRELESKRDYMADFLVKCGMKPTVPEGGFFLLADYTPVGKYSSNFYSSSTY